MKVFPGDTIRSFKFYGNGPNADSLGRLYMQRFKNYNWGFPLNQDSLAEWFNLNFQGDSTFFGRPLNFENRMEEFEKEMEKFREEMERLKREIRKDTIRERSSKPVEI